MSRVAATIMLLCGMVLVVGGCSRSPTQQPVPTTASASVPVLVLTAGRPVARVSQPRQPSATAIRLTLLTVTNPSSQGLVFGVDVESIGTAARTAHVGDVSNYPSDHAGVFTLPLPAPAAELVNQEPTDILVTMGLALPGTLQPGVQVSLTAIAV